MKNLIYTIRRITQHTPFWPLLCKPGKESRLRFMMRVWKNDLKHAAGPLGMLLLTKKEKEHLKTVREKVYREQQHVNPKKIAI